MVPERESFLFFKIILSFPFFLLFVLMILNQAISVPVLLLFACKPYGFWNEWEIVNRQRYEELRAEKP
ncbi:hypothetical protein [Nitrosomonas marina]|uniref:hypothetical protein n=1 Tax=Nitrosomonas marina TaxID=917 RepID=UPI000B83BAAF|nr:hypothetical protein [Nitrosomonas marina]